MRSLERRFKIETDKHPEYSSLVNFGRAVANQRFTKPVIVKWFYELVDNSDYDKDTKDDVIEHMLELSNSQHGRETRDTD